MEAQVILCDWAEVVNNKLYIMGAGWDRAPAGTPFPLAVALLIMVPWTETNKKHVAQISMVTTDGSPALPALPPGAPEAMRAQLQPVQGSFQFEVGRPPGATEGTAIIVPLSLRIPAIVLDAKRYVFQLTIDNVPIESAPFEAVGG
jgi:hypothetical protein